MKIKSTKFKDLKIISSQVHYDKRGFFRETFKNNFFLKKKFIFTCVSSSKKNVIRGLHLQKKFAQGKYLSVLKGEIFDVVVDLSSGYKGKQKIPFDFFSEFLRSFLFLMILEYAFIL